MENKYYVPKIKEFCYEFEYEVYVPEKEKWSKEIFYFNNSHIELIEYVDIQTEDTLRKIRVKYLDKKDIESFNWEHTSDNKTDNYSKFELRLGNTVYDIWDLRIEWNSHRVWITESIYNHGRFLGTIKNKSELKRVLTQLGIIND